MSNEVKYSVVVPVYNSANSLTELCDRLHKAFNGINYEMILVDDGSHDNSWKIISGLKQKYSNLIAIQFSKNFGQHPALFCGLSYSTGDFIITIDDDLQHPPEEIVKLIQKQKENNADVVYGVYKNKQHSFLRNSGSFFVRKTATIAEGYSGTGSSFRLIKKNIIEKIVANNKQNFFYLDEIFYWYTSSIAYTDVDHHHRKDGQSGYSLRKLFDLYFNILVNYSASPLRVMIRVGVFFSIISFILGLRFIYRKLVFKVPLGYTSIIVTILFSASIIMLCLGIIGQYLYKIYQANQNKPPYFIREVLK